MSLIDGKQILDNSLTSAEADTSGGAISTINAGDVAVEGSGTGLSKRDHQHAVSVGGATAQADLGDVAAEGVSASLAREDHQHAFPAGGAPSNVDKSAAGAGVATTPSRSDHKHDVATASAVELTDATNAEGAATELARADHQHAHGNRGGGLLHALASGVLPGFMSSAEKLKLAALVDPNLLAPKDAIRLLSTANVTLSGAQTVDGLATVVGDRIGVFSQATGSQDGIYEVQAGVWTRTADFDSASSQSGSVFAVEEGTANGDTFWQVTNDNGSDVVGVDDFSVLQVGAGSPRGAGAGLSLSGNDLVVGANADGSIVVNATDLQVGVLATDGQHGVRGGGTQHALAISGGADGFTSGADKLKLDGVTAGAEPNATERQETLATQVISGTDTVLVAALAAAPIPAASLSLYLNGVLQDQGAGLDYTVAGTAITWLQATGTPVPMSLTDKLTAKYRSA